MENRNTITVKYDEVLQYKGPRTSSRFMYLLHNSRGEKHWIRQLHHIADEMKAEGYTTTRPYILVEIVESLDTKSDSFLATSFTLLL